MQDAMLQPNMRQTDFDMLCTHMIVDTNAQKSSLDA